MLRTGIIGAGSISQRAHLPAARRTPDVEVVALCDRRPKLLREVANRWSIPRAYEHLEEMLADPDVEAVIACVPTIAHHEVACAALRAGRHVLVEKPMATSVARAQEMLRAEAEGGGRLMIGHHKRYDLGVEAARRALQAGGIGAPQFLTYHWSCGDWTSMGPEPVIETDEPGLPWTYEYPDGVESVGARELYGTALEMFTHMTNLLRWLVGDPTRVLYAAKPEGIRGMLTLDFGGFTGHLTEGPHYPDAPVWFEQVTVWGDAGRLEIDLPPNLELNKPAEVRVWEARADTWQTPVVPWSWAFQRQLEHFARCVQTGEPFRTPGTDALIDLEIAEATARAAEAGANGWSLDTHDKAIAHARPLVGHNAG
jgi:predicted dehydrogenase